MKSLLNAANKLANQLSLTKLSAFVLVISTMMFALPLSADIYRYTAPDGKVYYTDQPKHKRYKRIIRSQVKKTTSPSLAIREFKRNKQKYTPIITAAAEKHQLDPKLLHAMIYTESAYNPTAISSAGAVGLMQLMPATAKRFGVTNSRDPKQNIDGGARYLKFLLELFESDLNLAVAAYNAGENAVKKYKNSIPPYPETQNYVKKVLRLYRKQT